MTVATGAASEVLAEVPGWAERWPCEGCSRSCEPDRLFRILGGIHCAACVALVGVPEDRDLEGRLGRPDRQGRWPFPHQLEGCRWLSARRCALLADEQGVSKTAQALLAAPADMGVLVVAPTSVVDVWSNEAADWRPDLEVQKRQPTVYLPGPGQLLVVSYETLARQMLGLGLGASGSNPVTLVFDEAQKAKTPGRFVTKACHALRDAVLAAGGRVWVLTGTPMGNNPGELWHVLQLAYLAFAAFEDWENFESLFWGWYSAKNREDRTAPTGQAQEKLLACLAPFRLRRLKRDVLKGIPAKQVETILVDLRPEDAEEIQVHIRMLVATQIAWDDARAGRLEDPDAKGIGRDERRKRLDRLHEHARGVLETLAEPSAEQIRRAVDDALSYQGRPPTFVELARVRGSLATAKIHALRSLVEEHEARGEPLVVFSSHRRPIEVLGARPGWVTIQGKVPPKRRTEAVRQLQAGEVKGIAVTTRSGGTGLTLTKAATVVFVDEDWDPTRNAQASDRVHRPGQERVVRIIRLVARHVVDERVAEVNQEKINLINAVDGVLGGAA